MFFPAHAGAYPAHMNRVDTAVAERRLVRFDSSDQLLADVRRLAAAEQEGALLASGNWSLGQALGHLAAWMNYGYDGYPPMLRPPWIIKVLSRVTKKKYLANALKPGFRIPGLPTGTVGDEPLPTPEALARFNTAWARLRNAPPAKPNLLFGVLTHEEWINLHLRHAELHLSFFHLPPSQSTADSSP